MIGNPRKTDSSKKDRVMRSENLQSVIRHHLSVFRVVFAAPVEMGVVEAKTVADVGHSIQDLTTGRHGFQTDAVSRNGSYVICLHCFAPA